MRLNLQITLQQLRDWKRLPDHNDFLNPDLIRKIDMEIVFLTLVLSSQIKKNNYKYLRFFFENEKLIISDENSDNPNINDTVEREIIESIITYCTINSKPEEPVLMSYNERLTVETLLTLVNQANINQIVKKTARRKIVFEDDDESIQKQRKIEGTNVQTFTVYSDVIVIESTKSE